MSAMSLGEYLRQERERRGITIEQVASATKINVRLIYALEADNYRELPAQPFVRGFVNSYCRYVGLDSKEILARFARFIEEKSGDRPSREAGHSGYAFEKKESEQSRTLLWGVMTFSIVAGGVLVLVLKPALKHRQISHVDQIRVAAKQQAVEVVPAPPASPLEPQPPKPEEAKGVGASQATVVAPPASLAPEAQPPAKETNEVVDATQEVDAQDPLQKGDDLKPDAIKTRVTFKALADLWVRYQVDARRPMKFLLKKDKFLVLKAADVVRFQVSNPRAVQYRYRKWEYQPLDQLERISEYSGTKTVVFPFDKAESIGNPFPEAEPLPVTGDPGPQESSPNSSVVPAQQKPQPEQPQSVSLRPPDLAADASSRSVH